jgi:hypothetical protein
VNRVFRILLRTSLALLFVLGVGAVAAQSSLFSGEAVVVSQDEAERTRALGPALLQVLIKASGERALAEREGIAEALAQAPELLTRWSYRQDTVPVAGGVPRTQQVLVADFDPAGVERLLGRLGRSVWGERPRTLLALVIDDGATKRIASAAQIGALGAFTSVARARGIEVRLPDMNGADLASLDAAVLWSGRFDTALAGAGRYGARVALIARLARAGAGWSARFAYVDGPEAEQWSGTYADANQALAAGATGLADRLARRHAIPSRDRVEGEYTIWIDGIREPEDYAGALAYLRQLSVVLAVDPIGASGERMLLRLRLAVTPQRLRSLIEVGGAIAVQPAGAGSSAPFELRWLAR